MEEEEQESGEEEEEEEAEEEEEVEVVDSPHSSHALSSFRMMVLIELLSPSPTLHSFSQLSHES